MVILFRLFSSIFPGHFSNIHLAESQKSKENKFIYCRDHWYNRDFMFCFRSNKSAYFQGDNHVASVICFFEKTGISVYLLRFGRSFSMTFSESSLQFIGGLLVYFNWIPVPVFCLLSLVFFLISRKWRWLGLNSLNALLFPVGMTICFLLALLFHPCSMLSLALYLTVGAGFMVCPSFTLADAWNNHDKCLFAAALTAIGFYVSWMLLMIGVSLVLPFA